VLGFGLKDVDDFVNEEKAHAQSFIMFYLEEVNPKSFLIKTNEWLRAVG